MARRSATNPRYQKDAQIGKTRRSAASAKPKRGQGEAASSVRKKESKGKKRIRFSPDTPEFRRWRRIWLVLLLGAVILSISAFVFREGGPVATVTLVAAYVCLFGAFFVDLTKIRRLRKEWVASQKNDDMASKGKG